MNSKVFLKKCTEEEVEEPPPLGPCELKNLEETESILRGRNAVRSVPKCTVDAGPPPPEAPPEPECFGICIEKVKNPPYPKRDPCQEGFKICEVEREVTTTERCDRIAEELKSASNKYDKYGCPPPTPPPPPPPLDVCELQRNKDKEDLCRERMRRWLE